MVVAAAVLEVRPRSARHTTYDGGLRHVAQVEALVLSISQEVMVSTLAPVFGHISCHRVSLLGGPPPPQQGYGGYGGGPPQGYGGPQQYYGGGPPMGGYGGEFTMLARLLQI